MIRRAVRNAARRVEPLLPESLTSRLRAPDQRYRMRDIPFLGEAPATSTRVLIGPVNYAAQGYRIARALERLPDVGATAMQTVFSKDLGFPADQTVPRPVYLYSRSWQRAQAEFVADNYTHVAIGAGAPLLGQLFGGDSAREAAFLRERGVRILSIAYGSELRLPARHREIDEWSPYRDSAWKDVARLEANSAAYHAYLDRLDAPLGVTTPDMLLDRPGAVFVPISIDPSEWRSDLPVLERPRPVVVHAPTNAVLKGSDLIAPVVERLHDEGVIDYRRVEGLPAREMRRVFGEADVVLDQFRLGMYATGAIESMAAGRLVVAYLHDQGVEHIRDAFGLEVPVASATPATLEALLRDVAADRERYRARAATGPAFVAALHDGAATADAMARLLADAR